MAIVWLLSGYRFSAVRADSLPKLNWQKRLQQRVVFVMVAIFLDVSLWAMYDRRWAVQVLTSTEEPMHWHHTVVKRACVWSKSHHLQPHDICVAVGLLLLCHSNLVQRQG